MPRTIETPIAASWINHYKIVGTHLYEEDAYGNDDPRCVIEIARGYLAEDAEKPVRIDVITHEVRGAAMIEAMLTQTTGDTIRNEVKRMLYARCVADEVIPADAVDT